jgi:hypothetical protein
MLVELELVNLSPEMQPKILEMVVRDQGTM